MTSEPNSTDASSSVRTAIASNITVRRHRPTEPTTFSESAASFQVKSRGVVANHVSFWTGSRRTHSGNWLATLVRIQPGLWLLTFESSQPRMCSTAGYEAPRLVGPPEASTAPTVTDVTALDQNRGPLLPSNEEGLASEAVTTVRATRRRTVRRGGRPSRRVRVRAVNGMFFDPRVTL